MFDTSPAVGAGAGSYPGRRPALHDRPGAVAQQAHSYVFQTLADLGLVGLVISLALARAWIVAAIRTTGPLRPRAPGGDAAERIGLVTMVAVVVVFVVHSAIDWTWFVPADAVSRCCCAGWVAGRGPPRTSARRDRRAQRRSPRRRCAAGRRGARRDRDRR